MAHSPIRWLATLALLSGLLTALPLRADARPGQQPPKDLSRIAARAQVPTADMPDLVGLSLQAAQQHAVVVKLRLTLVPETVDSPKDPPGTIISQSVAAGRPVRAGTRIAVSVTSEGVKVPLVEGELIDRAGALLEKLGFRFEVSDVSGAGLRPGRVIRQAPKAGTLRPRGSVVRLEVSAPPAKDQGDFKRDFKRDFTIVPDVMHTGERTALSRLEDARLQGKVRQLPSREKPGVVIDQQPKEGTRVAPGTVVDLTVSIPLDDRNTRGGKGEKTRSPDLVIVPDLVGSPVDRARQTLISLGLSSRERAIRDTGGRPGEIIKHAPAAGATVERGSEVELVVAAEQPPRKPPPTPQGYMPNLVGQTVATAVADAMVLRLKLRIIPRDDPKADGSPGSIAGQSVAPGTPVDFGSDVTVWVATGVAVPALVGLGRDAARERVQALRLQAEVSDVIRDRDIGSVVEQTPAAGTVVQRGAAVELSVAVARMVKVPDLGGRDRRQALSLLKVNGLIGEFSIDEKSALAPGLVSGQEPGAGAELPVGATVRVRLASGVLVPSVIGATLREARAQISSSSLSVDSREVRTDRAPASTVFEQTPAAGQRVARGTVVTLSVALPPLVTVPDVVGRSRGDATATLVAARLNGEIDTDPASELAPGTVSAQDPAPGSQVPAASAVRLKLAVGVIVPTVVGVDATEAHERIASSGLRDNVKEVRTDRAPTGTVFEQSPPDGRRVARGSLVELTVARPPLVVVPDLSQRTQAEATSVTRAVRLGVAFEDDPKSTLPPDRVTRQDPPAGATVEIEAIVRAALAKGTLVPPVVNMPVRTARRALEASGLRAEEVSEVHDAVPESTVIRQAPGSNARVALGSSVRLVVAVRRTMTMPDLIGKARTEVEQLLTPIPLVIQFAETATATTGAAAGTVVEQVPAAGTTVGAGTAVRVVLLRAAAAQTPARADTPQPLSTGPASATPGVSRSPVEFTSVIPWIVGLGLFGLVGYRFYNANRGGVEREPPPAQPSPAVQLDPHVEETRSRLEVSGSGLVQFEVRIRTTADGSEPSLSVEGSLIGNERRLYE